MASQCSTILPFSSKRKKSIVTYSSFPGQIWSAEHADESLHKIMKGIYQRTRSESDVGGRIDLCRGADRAGFRRVARAVAWIGAM